MYYILKCEEHLPQQFVATQHLAEQQKRLSDRIRENKMRVAAAKFFEDVQKASKIVTMFDIEKTPDGKSDRTAAAKALPQGAAATIDGRQVSLQQLADECILRHGEEVLGVVPKVGLEGLLLPGPQLARGTPGGAFREGG